MTSFLRRMTSIFSSSAPTIKQEETSSPVGSARFSDVEERDDEDERHATEPEAPPIIEEQGEMDVKDPNGFQDGAEEEGGGNALLVKPTKTKGEKKKKKEKRKTKKLKALQVGEEIQGPEAADINHHPFEKRTPSDGAQDGEIAFDGAAKSEVRPKSKGSKRVNGEKTGNKLRDEDGEDLRVVDQAESDVRAKSTSARKANGEKKGRKSREAAVPVKDHTRHAPEADMDDPEAVAEMLNSASKRKRAEKASKPATTAPAIIKPWSRPTMIHVAPVVGMQVEDPRDHIIPDDLTELPKKIRKAKKKLKESNNKTAEQAGTNREEDEDNSPAVLHRPLTPATTPHAHGRDTQEDKSFHFDPQTQMDIQPAALSDHASEDNLPKQPSKKALGKRKASDELSKSATKRLRRKEDTPNADIRQFGTILPPQATTTSQRPHSATSMERKEGGNGGNFAASAAAPILPPSMDSVRKSRRDTPQFTPINKKFATINKAFASVNNRYTLTADSTETPDIADEFAPAETPEEPDEPETIQPPKRGLKAPSPSGEPEALKVQSRKLLAKPRRDSEVLGPREDIDPPPPHTHVRRKRRLPTGEPGASEVRPAKTTPAKAWDSTPKTPKTATSTPRPRATPVGTGKGLTKDEIETITEAVENYQLHSEMEQFTLNALIQSSAQTGGQSLKEFWNEICSQVPGIPKQKVINACRRKFHNFIRGSWSEEQDAELREAYERNPGKWKIISESINRFPEDARLRWRDYLVCGDNMKKDVWDKEEEERLREVVHECLENIRENKRTSDDTRYKQTDDESLIDWKTVSQMMNLTRSRLQCTTKWKSLKDREDSGAEDITILAPIAEAKWRVSDAAKLARAMKPREKLRLLRAIRDSAAGREGKIPWRPIAEQLDMKGKRMALKVCFRNLRINVPGNQDMKLQDIILYLIDAFEAAAPAEPHGFDKEDIRIAMASQSKRKHKRKGDSDNEVSFGDNGESSSNGNRRKRPRLMKERSEKFIEELPDDGEGSTARKSRKSSRSKSSKKTDVDEDEGNNAETLIPPKKRTIRARMKRVEQTPRQETTNADVSDDNEDIGNELQSAWTSISTTPRAKKPLMAAKTSRKKKSRPLSEVRVVEDESDGAQANGSSSPAHEDAAQAVDYVPESDEENNTHPGGFLPKSGEDVSLATNSYIAIEDDEDEDVALNGNSTRNDHSEDDMDVDAFADFTAPNIAPDGPNAYDSSEDSSDEYPRNMYNEDEDYNQDDEHNITMSGFHRDESVDLDNPPDQQGYSRSNSDELGSSFRNMVNGYPRSGSVSSGDSDSSIPAVPRKDPKIEPRRMMEGSPEPE